MNQTADRASLLADLSAIHGDGSVMMRALETATDEELVQALRNARASVSAGRRGERLADVWTTDAAFEAVGGR